MSGKLKAWLVIAAAFSLSVSGQRNVPSQTLTTTHNTPALTFDLASIRECKASECGGQAVDDPPHVGTYLGRNLWLVQLIGWAYGVDWRAQVQGGPDWVKSTGFNIHAKSDSDADNRLAKLTDDQAKLEKQHMLQMLLADRFKLKVHTEAKRTQVFVLTIAKAGRKLQNADSFGNIGSRGDTRGIEIIGHGVSVADFIKFLQYYLHTIVIDKTALTGIYNFDLQFHGMYSDIENNDDGSKWPPVETAIKEQLGLELSETIGSMNVIVIDHIEKPSEN